MSSLIACLSSGKGTGNHVLKVIEGMDWEKVFVVAPAEMRGSIPESPKIESIIIDINQTISEIAEVIKAGLRGKIPDFEVGLNIVSGSGKEHMALLKAVLESGIGIRLVALTKEGIKSI